MKALIALPFIQRLLLAIGLSVRVMAVQRREEWERYRRLKQRQEQAARQTGYGYGYADRPRPG